MTIDAHAHACGELHNIDGMMKYLSDNKLDQVVLCPGEPNNTKNRNVPMISALIKSSSLGYRFNRVIRLATSLSGVTKHIDNQNEAIACLANDYPDKIIQAYWVNPLESNCIQKLENNYLKHNFHVVKMHQCWHNFDILQDNVEKIIQWSMNKNLPIFIHLLSKEQSIKFAKLTNRFPNAVFIVGHMIGFEDIIANSKNENVYFDISAPYLIAYKTLEIALSTVGSGRLILGSDTPYGENSIEINVSRIKRLGLSDEQQESIMGNNFIKLIRTY